MTKLIKLYKNDCAPCKLVENYLKDNNTAPDEEYNIMENSEKAIQFSVMSVPVLILLDDEGNEIQRSIGFKPNEIEEIISLNK